MPDDASFAPPDLISEDVAVYWQQFLEEFSEKLAPFAAIHGVRPEALFSAIMTGRLVTAMDRIGSALVGRPVDAAHIVWGPDDDESA